MKVRDHRIYEIGFVRDTQDRIEDSIGELQGYSEKYEMHDSHIVIAPCADIAKAWVCERHRFNNIRNVQVLHELEITGFVEDHTY